MKFTKKHGRAALLKYMLVIPLSIGLTAVSLNVKAQDPPGKATPPPPPPSPGEVLNKINPFKKNKKPATPPKEADKGSKQESVQPGDGPPPPPNPLNLFKKKKTAAPAKPAPASR